MNSKKRKFPGQTQNEEFTLLSLFKSCGIFLLIFAAISAVCIVVLALIFYKTNDPTSHIGLCALISLYFSCFISSFAMSKKNGQKHLIGGLMLGLFIIILTLAISLIFSGEPVKNSVLLRAMILVATLIGSVLGSFKKEVKHKKHKIRT